MSIAQPTAAAEQGGGAWIWQAAAATMRGRAMAGAYGETRARIFCRRLQAELLAVGGTYLTADEIDQKMLSQNVQIWLEGEDVKIAQLN